MFQGKNGTCAILLQLPINVNVFNFTFFLFQSTMQGHSSGNPQQVTGCEMQSHRGQPQGFLSSEIPTTSLQLDTQGPPPSGHID